MVKVLYITDSLKKRFGVTSVITNYIGHIKDSRVHIDVLAYDDSENGVINELKTYGADVYLMPKLSFKTIFKFIEFIKSFFKHHKYQIIHSHFNQIDCIVFPIAKKYGVKHCISHSHNTRYSDYFLRGIRNEIMCIPLPRLADTWAACSNLAGEFLYGEEFNKSQKKLVINNAIDTSLYKLNSSIRKEKRNELGIDDDEIVIGNVGSLKLQKNQGFLINVMNSLLQSNIQKYKLVIVGDGELKDSLMQQAKNLNLEEKIIFTGSRSDVNCLMQAFDIFALPSLYEGLPVTGIEAQASGLPCLLSDKITKEVNILNTKYLPIDNVDEWVEEILLTKCDNRFDCSKEIINAGFDITTEAQKLAEFYIRIAN